MEGSGEGFRMLRRKANVLRAIGEEAKDVAMKCDMIDFISSVSGEPLQKRARIVEAVHDIIRTLLSPAIHQNH